MENFFQDFSYSEKYDFNFAIMNFPQHSHVQCIRKYPSVFLPCTIFAPGKVAKTMWEVL